MTGTTRSAIGAAVDATTVRAPRRGAVGNTAWGREGPGGATRVILHRPFCCLYEYTCWCCSRLTLTLTLTLLHDPKDGTPLSPLTTSGHNLF